MDHDSGMGTGGLMIHVEGGQREGLEEDGIRLHRPGFFHFFGFQDEIKYREATSSPLVRHGDVL